MMSFDFNVTRRTWNNRMEQRKELIPYILEYLETHNYVSAKKLALFYIEKKGIINYNDITHNILVKNLIRRISGYFCTLTKEGYKQHKETSNRNFIRTDKIIRGLNDLLEGKKMVKHNYGNAKSRVDSNLNIEWRKLEDLVKNETTYFNGKEHAKLYHLGVIDNTDPHFKELWMNKSRNHNIKVRRKKLRMTEKEILIKFTINYISIHNLYNGRVLANKYIDKLMDFNPNLLRSVHWRPLMKTFKKIITDLKLELINYGKYWLSNEITINTLKEKLNNIKVNKKCQTIII